MVIQRTLSTRRIPTNGGRWVIALNTGTSIKPPTPTKNTTLRCPSEKLPASMVVSALWAAVFTVSSPLSIYCMIKAGTTIETIDGTRISDITPAAVMTPLFQSIMVVTSPIGEKAPPELAAMITNDA